MRFSMCWVMSFAADEQFPCACPTSFIFSFVVVFRRSGEPSDRPTYRHRPILGLSDLFSSPTLPRRLNARRFLSFAWPHLRWWEVIWPVRLISYHSLILDETTLLFFLNPARHSLQQISLLSFSVRDSLRAERLSRILVTRGLKSKASAFEELLPDFFRLTDFIEDEYKSACLAEDVGGGYSGNRQNWVCSSSTNGIKSPESPMMWPGFGPSRIHRRACVFARICEKSNLDDVGITRASL